jgi:phosphopantetheinyl transferase
MILHGKTWREKRMPGAAETGGRVITLRADAVAAAVARLRETGFVLVLASHRADSDFLPPASDAEHASAGRSRDPAGHLLRRRMTRAIAGGLMGHAATDFVLTASGNGQPILSGPGGLHVSFATRGDLSLVGITTRPVGVDLEEAIMQGGIPWNILRPDEAEALRTLPEAARTVAFLDLWTAKEAVLKALGAGLHIAPEALWISRDGIVCQRQDPSSDKAWRTLPLQVSWPEHHDVFHNTTRIAFALLSNGDFDPFVPGQS